MTGWTNVSYTYQWVRNDGNSDTDIVGATELRLHPGGRRRGSRPSRWRVTVTDDAENETTLTSEATDAVVAAARARPSEATGLSDHRRHGPGR